MEPPHNQGRMHAKRLGVREHTCAGDWLPDAERLGKGPSRRSVVSLSFAGTGCPASKVNIQSTVLFDVPQVNVRDLVQQREEDAVKGGNAAGQPDDGTDVVEERRAVDLAVVQLANVHESNPDTIQSSRQLEQVFGLSDCRRQLCTETFQPGWVVISGRQPGGTAADAAEPGQLRRRQWSFGL